MLEQSLRRPAMALLTCFAMLAFSGTASADPPSRVARLGYVDGAVSYSPAGENDWVEASINRPLTNGDRLWADARSRAEIQVGGAAIRMGADTGVSVLNLDDQITQLELTQGTLNVHVRRLDSRQVFEVDTPNLAFSLRQPGEYRIEVDPAGDATTILVRKGRGEAYGDGAAYVIDARQAYRFTGSDLRDYRYVEAPRLDEFDRWSIDRDRHYDASISARYVSQDVVGYQDLDANGTWRVDVTYGNVWVPNRVDAGWAPYRDGHWAWVDPWGWTWVDDAPWGFAVSHYGRWANLQGTWGWIPGPVRSRAYYAPALVVFIGGDNFQISISSGSVGGVAWFPLGPREVYRPAYRVSRDYFQNLNRSNTVINTTVINNYYDNRNVTNVVYANRHVAGAVVAVPTTAFVQSQRVSRAAVHVSREALVSAPVATTALVAPTHTSVHGTGARTDKPPSRVFDRPVVARTAPPAAHAGFAAQQQQLIATPGRPLDENARKETTAAPAARVPKVKVITPAIVAQPTGRPPPATPVAPTRDARAKPERPERSGKVERLEKPEKVEKAGESVRSAATPPPASKPEIASPPVDPAAPTARPAPQRPAQVTPREAPAVAAPVLQPQPQPQPREQRGKSDRRDDKGQPQPAATPPAATTAPAEIRSRQAAKPERGLAAKSAETREPDAASSPAAASPQQAPAAQPRGRSARPDAGKSDDRKQDADERKREEQERKRKG